MRVKFINKMGTYMTVDESRKEEYMEAGYKLVSDIPSPKKKATRKKTQEKKED